MADILSLVLQHDEQLVEQAVREALQAGGIHPTPTTDSYLPVVSSIMESGTEYLYLAASGPLVLSNISYRKGPLTARSGHSLATLISGELRAF